MNAEETARERADAADAADARLTAFVRDPGDDLDQVREDVADLQHRLDVALEVGGAEQARRITAEAALAAERRQRAEVYRQHAGLTAELDRATTDRDRTARHLSDARTTISRLEVEATGRERLTTRACIERDAAVDERRNLEQRIAAAVEVLGDEGRFLADELAAEVIVDVRRILRGETR